MIVNMDSTRFFLIVAAFFLSFFPAFGTGRTEGSGQSSKDGPLPEGADAYTLISMEPSREKPFPGAGNSADEILAAQLFTGPLEYDPGAGRFVGSLAADWEFSPDRMSCRIRLGRSLWSDGSVLSASQLRASWIAVLKSDSPAASFLASHIRGGRGFLQGDLGEDRLGIRIGRENDLELAFEKPCGPEILAAPAFYAYPPELFEAEDSLYGLPEGLRCSGAYELEGREEGLIILKRRADGAVADGRPSSAPGGIRIIVPGSRTEALERYRDREADWLAPDAFPPRYAELMEERADYLAPPGFSSYFFILNGERSPLDRREIRERLIGSIDRSELLKELGVGSRQRAFSLLPPALLPHQGANAMPGKNSRPGGDIGDPEGPVRYAEEEVRSDPLILICPSDKGHVLSAEALARQWREKTGLTIELRPLEGREFFRARREGDYHLASGGWSFSSPDPLSLLLQFLPGALYGGSGGRQFEKACVEILAEGDDAGRRESLVREAERELLTGESLVLPLFFDSRPQLLRSVRWKGLSPAGWHPPRFSRLYRL